MASPTQNLFVPLQHWTFPVTPSAPPLVTVHPAGSSDGSECTTTHDGDETVWEMRVGNDDGQIARLQLRASKSRSSRGSCSSPLYMNRNKRYSSVSSRDDDPNGSGGNKRRQLTWRMVDTEGRSLFESTSDLALNDRSQAAGRAIGDSQSNLNLYFQPADLRETTVPTANQFTVPSSLPPPLRRIETQPPFRQASVSVVDMDAPTGDEQNQFIQSIRASTIGNPLLLATDPREIAAEIRKKLQLAKTQSMHAISTQETSFKENSLKEENSSGGIRENYSMHDASIKVSMGELSLKENSSGSMRRECKVPPPTVESAMRILLTKYFGDSMELSS